MNLTEPYHPVSKLCSESRLGNSCRTTLKKFLKIIGGGMPSQMTRLNQII